MSIHDTIAVAIKKADKSYFFENYSDQASEVLRVLDRKGYIVIPRDPTEDMVKAGADSIASGQVKPDALVKQVFGTMLNAWKRR